MRDTPDWNRDEQSLFRGDSRTPAEIRADGGFRPPYETRPDWQNHPERNAADIAQHVGGNTNAFVSTSTDRGVAQDFAIAGHVYVINAPGGIYTDPSMRPATGRESHGEAEVLFPGGVNWDYVRGWHPVTYEPGSGFVTGDFVPNPDYGGSHSQQHSPDQYGPASHDATRTAEPSREDTSPLTQPHSGEPRLGDRMGPLGDPRLDALRPHLQSTDGGMSAFAPSDSHNEQYTANQVPRIPRQFVVDMHGSADAVRVGDTPLSPRDLADIIRANPDYDGGPVSLLGCGTGSTPDGFAARLAQELGVPVTAPNSDAWVDHNGNVFASTQAYNHDPSQPARPTWPPNGQWSTYSPTGEQTVHSGPFPPGHTPSWASDDPAGDAVHRGDDVSTADEAPEPRTWDEGDPADVMQQMVDQELTAYWANFAYDRREFQEWCQSPTEASLPEIRPETRINCWEMVMYSAVVSGQLSHAEANRIYDFVNTPEGRTPWFEQLPDRLAPGGRNSYDPDGPPPQRGDLVFWDGSNHVAMATGRIVNDSPEIYTFWPPPDTPFTIGPVPEAPDRTGWGTQDRVKTSTIKELTDFINRQREEGGQPPVVVETGAPVWAGEP